MAEPRLWLSVQYLRGFAALSVVLFHALQWSRVDFATGQAGVDVFFVISGFIMWTTTAAHGGTPAAFLKRRFIRVAPLYWLITLALAAAVAVFPAKFPDLSAEPKHVLLSMAFIQHYNPAGVPFPLLTPGWTLNYEAAFYLVFAACLFIAAQERRLFVLTFSLLVLAFAGYAWPPFHVLLLNPLFLEFLAGVWIARMAQLQLLPDRAIGWALLAGGVGLFAIIQMINIDWDLWRPMVWGAPSAMLVCGAVAIEADGGWPKSGILKALGDASYSTYLVHTLPIGALAVLYGSWNIPVFVPASLGLAVAAGLACWWFIERPLIAWLRRLA